MKKFRTAVIGCGGISQVHLTALSKMENVELVSVDDVKEDRAKAKAEAFHLSLIHISEPTRHLRSRMPSSA